MARKKKSASIVRCAWRTMLQVFKKVAARRTRTDHAWCYVRSLQPVEETSAPLNFFLLLFFLCLVFSLFVFLVLLLLLSYARRTSWNRILTKSKQYH